MNALDLSAINVVAPYSVWCVNDYYYFKTKYDIIYKVGFMPDDTIWETGAYQFLIINENNQPSPRDSKLKQTVFCIIEAFFNTNPDILLYLCETGDGKQAARNRLFIRWFKDYADNSLFYFGTCELRAEGIDNFAAIIVQRSNPELKRIINDFNDVVATLKEKPA